MHEETVRIVDEQMKHLDVQLQALDEILSKVRDQNTRHHDAHIDSLSGLSSSVKQSYASIGVHLMESSGRAQTFEADFKTRASSVAEFVPPLNRDVSAQLSELRENILNAPLVEYSPTGQTPQKQQYQYQSTLPRTEAHEQLLRTYRGIPDLVPSPELGSLPPSPSKTAIYTDADAAEPISDGSSPVTNKKPLRPESSHSSLRELDANIVPGHKTDSTVSLSAADAKSNAQQPPLKRQNTAPGEYFLV